MESGKLPVVAQNWARRLSEAPQHYAAIQVYCGRVVTEALKATELLRADLSFVSAGLGLVGWQENIPSYNLTVAPGAPDSIQDRIQGAFSPGAWWKGLLKARGVQGTLDAAIKACDGDLILLALPASYLAMLEEALVALKPETLTTLRIIGPRRETDLPGPLRGQWLPYDARLDNPKSGFNGTASDFPQRALHHFVSVVLKGKTDGSVEKHRDRVDGLLKGLKPYVRSCGEQTTDDKLLKVLKQLWTRHSGVRSRMLRDLRDNTGLACEQKRFQRLVSQYEESLRGQK